MIENRLTAGSLSQGVSACDDMGKITKALRREFEDAQKRKLVPFTALAEAARTAESTPDYQQLVRQGHDPVHAVYITTINLGSTFLEFAADLPPFQAVLEFISDAQDLYMPGYPAMSPITGSLLSTWTLLARIFHTLSATTCCEPVWLRWPRSPRRTVCTHTARLGTASAAWPDRLSLRLATKVYEISGLDVPFGPDQETVGDCFAGISDLVELGALRKQALDQLRRSRLGLYELTASGGNRVHLREVVTNAELEALIPTGFRGEAGRYLLVHLLPPLSGETPYRCRGCARSHPASPRLGGRDSSRGVLASGEGGGPGQIPD